MNGNVLYTLIGITFIIAVTGLIIAGLHENRIKTETVEFKFSAATNGSEAKVTFTQPKDTVLLNEVVVIPTAAFDNNTSSILQLKLGTTDGGVEIMNDGVFLDDQIGITLSKDKQVSVGLTDGSTTGVVISNPLATKSRTVHATLTVYDADFTELTTVKVMFKFARFD